MPHYDFRCLDCHKRFEVFLTYSQYGKEPVKCPVCGSLHVTRKIGRIRVLRSDDRRLESFSDTDNLEGLEDNPKELGHLMRKMSSELGEDVGPEFDEVVGRLEAGQSPEEIEKSLPELGLDEGISPGPGEDLDDF